MGGLVADNFDLSVKLKIEAEGAKPVASDIERLQDLVDKLARSQDINEKATRDLTTEVNRQSTEVRKSSQATQQGTESLNSQRYALYEVAAAYGAVSAALIGIGGATVSAFADMESGFTKVERTSGLYGDSFAPLEADLLGLARTIPTVTSSIQDLASRGAQMGIAAGDVAAFTETMAKFVATSPEVDVNSVAESFGRLSNLTGTKDFEAMASAIAKVGVNSAATDAQIIKTTQELARAVSSTTLAADEVIGLAAAFASLGVAPEAARGVMNQFFVQLEKGAAGMNDSLDVAAQVMGTTAAEAKRLFETDTGDFFQRFVEGLPNVDSVTVALDEMGLSGQRLLPAFNALAADTERNAAGQSVLAKALADSNEGFREKTELDRQYAPIADDLNSKFVLMSNAVMELAYTVGVELAPALKGGMDALIGIVQAASEFVNSPVGGFITRLAVGLAAVAGAYAALRSAIALATAMMYAFSTAAGTAAATGLAGALRGLISLMGLTGKAASGAAVGTQRLTLALKGLGRVTVIGAVFMYVSEWLFNTGEQAMKTGDAMIWLADLAVEVGNRIGGAFGQLIAFNATNFLRTQGRDMYDWGKRLDDTQNKTRDFKDAWAEMPAVIDETAQEVSGLEDGFDGAADAAQDVVAEVRTLLDYGSDLKSVFDRAFDLRFSSEGAEDAVADSWQKIKDRADAARKVIAEQLQIIKDQRLAIRDINQGMKETRATMQGLQSEKATLQYWLKIAEAYGDTLRASEIRAELADNSAKLSKEENKLTDASEDLRDANKKIVDAQSKAKAEQDKLKLSTEGNTAAARESRAAVQNLIKSYQDQVVEAAKNGASQAELAALTRKLETDFRTQAAQAGLSKKEIDRYAGAFRDMKTVIDQVPRNITVSANTNPALQALREFVAKTKTAVADAKRAVGKGVNIPINTSVNTGGAHQAADLNSLLAQQANYLTQLNAAIARGDDNRAATLTRSINALRDAIKGIRGYSSGGYTGGGGKYEPAGVVHRGEYVVPKHQVNQRTGLPYADAMGQLVKGSQARTSYASGGFVGGGGSGVVDLSAHSIQQLARVVQNQIILDGRIVGEAASNSYAANTRVGAA